MNLPDPQTAYDNLLSGVDQEVFFRRLAAHGYAPQTVKQAEYLLDLGAKLQVVEEQAAVKQGNDLHDPYARASVALDYAMQKHGLDGHFKQAELARQEVAIRGAADELAQDPILYNSVLALKAAEAAEALQGQQG